MKKNGQTLTYTAKSPVDINFDLFQNKSPSAS